MRSIQLGDKTFELSITSTEIQKAIYRMADEMDRDLKDKNPLMICILNGSFMFAADVMKKFTTPCQVSFVKLASYQGTQTTGQVKELIGLTEDIVGRTVVLLEDIVDTGVTIDNLVKQLNGMGPREVKVATLLFKPDACKRDVTLDYVGLSIPNEFIVGYGLDYNGYGRNLPDIYSLVK
ncbi:hypoxanthine phosphoribosyltransferase [Breznakibacter xylanolyticus]|uniref:Hypoxanthine phosphoribosyltransferase n=1 Tax=Breznakibacter xylanolyticus TaxID=990 RepID=A0A2W7NHF1_9BACT|nr:hypoxanthine phosphoribosyltransferase [Breznakibacter xylanolyticus]MBN2744169.1 hypoxanthine phosphoribosyltransferase [Marinilabiliaceae bacterium]PZX19280.1 hypoxanthine phosphoribosyltransferase [Breznakibacter xylanolyticus]